MFMLRGPGHTAACASSAPAATRLYLIDYVNAAAVWPNVTMAAHPGGGPDTISRVGGQAATCDGQVVSISWKAWCTEAHGVMWEMPPLMLSRRGEG